MNARKREGTIFVVVVVLGAAWFFCGWPIVFNYQTTQRASRYAELNQLVINELEPLHPPSINVLFATSPPETARGFYGVVSTAEVSLPDEIALSDTIREYLDGLEADGWVISQRETSAGPIYLAIDQNACVRVVPNEGANVYYLTVFQDFDHQVFSPWRPPSRILAMYNFGKLTITKCPPE